MYKLSTEIIYMGLNDGNFDYFPATYNLKEINYNILVQSVITRYLQLTDFHFWLDKCWAPDQIESQLLPLYP